MTAQTKIFRIEIVLADADPVVRRVVEVPGEASLAVLHEVVQDAMGWEHAHLHEFDVDGARFGLPDPEWDAAVADESKVTLSGLLETGDQVNYWYDFGDDWHHRLVVEEVTAPEAGVRYPRCVAGQGACPPEDVGGVFGFEEFVEALADPAHPEHADRVEWWGSDRFDPHRFDLDSTDRALERLAWTPLPAAGA
ncbi:MAG: plasmid pRiA4b ORF-3 family protein [Actinophytocola sp.]|uniref:plasmid pRiA4b ORF-3 family protein n=1 Tax=Actinophytocola sp. TaxID=1872138 RepID=UPI003D6B0A33